MTKSYRKVERAKLLSWHSELSAWNAPEHFRQRVDEIMQLPDLEEALFKQAGLQFLLDAWIAGRVATALAANKVRLCTDERPDFELMLDGELRQYETTEADMPGRRRGDEPIDRKIEHDPVEDWRARFEAIPVSLKSVVRKKLEKNYSKDVGLVVYVNLGSYGAYRKEGLPILRDGTQMAKDAFKEVFVYWEGTLFRFWKNGRYSFAKWEAARVSDL